MATPRTDFGPPELQDPATVLKPRRRSFLAALVVSLRPRQWTKNLLLYAALLFTLDVKHSFTDILRSCAAFAIFCLLSGATYIVNDVLDIESDRAHPKKCRRPIARGEISPAAACAIAAVIFALTLAEAFHLRTSFGLAATAYVGWTLAYSLRLKQVVLLDLLVLALGFVLRAVAGAWVIGVSISEWLILCTMLLALFLGIAKRRGELAAVLDGRKGARGVISEYSADLLDHMSMIVTSALLMSYILYTFQSQSAMHHRYLMGSIPFVLYGIFRYLYLVHQKQQGESPDEVILKDRPLIVCIVLWALLTGTLIAHRF